MTEPNTMLQIGKRVWRGKAAVRMLWIIALCAVAIDAALIYAVFFR